MSDSLQSHGLQHASLPSPSPSPCSNSRPSSQWCHPTISSSVISFSSCLQSFPASGLSMGLQSQTRLKWLSSSSSSSSSHQVAKGLELQLQHQLLLSLRLIDLLLSKGLSRDFSSTTVWKHQFFNDQTSLWKEYWSGLPRPAPGDLPNPGIEPRSPALQVDLLPSESLGKPLDELYKI